ncbi:hypothetical protein B0H15DRAFT_944572 [Mycena belliarum]|uniref:Uncharacterized protein n=1 Tax=Mycena belliarum TaxID=1033014 RepID=A0AAD6UEY5_9AGAR|nr:hypothetical protein B0H15DRAFT_944572 [Mycena belliae]
MSSWPPLAAASILLPRAALVTAADYSEMAQNPDVRLYAIYTAALAAFTSDGGSELARQYLHLAAQHPKILGKFPERVTFDVHTARLLNGIEDARDHLFLTQELWSQEDVWNWTSADPVVWDRVHRDCDRASTSREAQTND